MTTMVLSAAKIALDAHFPALRDHIIASTGLDYYADRPPALAGHLADRFCDLQLEDCGQYLELLRDDSSGELDHLIELLTIGETHFFRHQELFDALRDVVLPDIVRRNAAMRRMRIWSAGCSSGAETYTLSVLLRRELGQLMSGWNVSILGTDVNRKFLARAEAGVFEEWSFRGTSPEFRQQCFERQENGWKIASQYRQGVSFAYHNLVRHPFPSLVHNLYAFDLILCRNVLIYFGPAVITRVVSQLTNCLSDEGWLAIGHAEHGFQNRAHLEPHMIAGVTVYQKTSASELDGVQRTCERGQPSPPVPRDESSRPLAPRRPFEDGGAQCRSKHGAVGASRPSTRPAGAHTPNALWGDELDRIQALADSGDIHRAVDLCEALIAKNSPNPCYFFYHALLLDQQGQSDAACQALQRAIYLDRTFVLAHYHLGMARQKNGKALDAKRSFRNVLQLISGRDRSECLPRAEGLTVADIDELTRMHLNSLKDS